MREANCQVEIYIWNPLLLFAEHRFPPFIYALFVPKYVLGAVLDFPENS